MKKFSHQNYIKAISILLSCLFVFCSCGINGGSSSGSFNLEENTTLPHTTTTTSTVKVTTTKEPATTADSTREETEKTTQKQSTTKTTSSQETTKAQEKTTKPVEKTTVSTTQPTKVQDSPYYIKVNKQSNCVTIYKKGADGEYTVPVKAMVCSTGANTPIGTFRTSKQYRWRLLIHNVWGQYATRITQDILFHSVPYDKKDPATLEAGEYNKLGESASAGCVRLTVTDAKWIYENCPLGTTVTVYNSADPGPLGKPSAQKIPADSKWDPTDPDKQNPWHRQEETTTQNAPQ